MQTVNKTQERSVKDSRADVVRLHHGVFLQKFAQYKVAIKQHFVTSPTWPVQPTEEQPARVQITHYISLYVFIYRSNIASCFHYCASWVFLYDFQFLPALSGLGHLFRNLHQLCNQAMVFSAVPSILHKVYENMWGLTVFYSGNQTTVSNCLGLIS